MRGWRIIWPPFREPDAFGTCLLRVVKMNIQRGKKRLQSLVFFTWLWYNVYKKRPPVSGRKRGAAFEEKERVFGLDSALSKEEARLLNPVVLAFVGDAVYSLYVREKLVFAGGGKAADFQRTAAKIVSAHGQSEFLEKLIPLLNEEETEIFRRGRNAKKATKSKNASVAEYNRSTGFEAVLGFLYVTGSRERIDELLSVDTDDSYKINAVSEGYRPGR